MGVFEDWLDEVTTAMLNRGVPEDEVMEFRVGIERAYDDVQDAFGKGRAAYERAWSDAETKVNKFYEELPPEVRDGITAAENGLRMLLEGVGKIVDATLGNALGKLIDGRNPAKPRMTAEEMAKTFADSWGSPDDSCKCHYDGACTCGDDCHCSDRCDCTECGKPAE